jgi:hypothetical protein
VLVGDVGAAGAGAAGAKPAGGAAPSAASSEKPDNTDPLLIVGRDFLIGFFIITILLRSVQGIKARTFGGVQFQAMLDRIFPVIDRLVTTYVSLANVASLFFLIATIYCFVRTHKIWKDWTAKYYPAKKPREADGSVAAAAPVVKNARWQLVTEHIQSDNPSDWRLSILEADIVLSELLETLGYRGDTIGDKLKNAERAPFRTLNQAWEAHKIRNAIAHEGQDFALTARDARRIIGLYEATFREFDFI